MTTWSAGAWALEHMRIGLPAETAGGERRAAIVPAAVDKLARGGTGEDSTGQQVIVQRGACAGALIPDEAYEEARFHPMLMTAAGTIRPATVLVLGAGVAGPQAIATALVPGRRAPILVTEEAVRLMKPGSVIVDLGGEAGSNCELSEPGESILRHDMKILAPLNVRSTMAEHASQLYARNVQAPLGLMIGEDRALSLDFDDEVIAGACITRDGEIVHEGAKAPAGVT